MGKKVDQKKYDDDFLLADYSHGEDLTED